MVLVLWKSTTGCEIKGCSTPTSASKERAVYGLNHANPLLYDFSCCSRGSPWCTAQGRGRNNVHSKRVMPQYPAKTHKDDDDDYYTPVNHQSRTGYRTDPTGKSKTSPHLTSRHLYPPRRMSQSSREYIPVGLGVGRSVGRSVVTCL